MVSLLDRYISGREAIRQLTNDSQTIPKRNRSKIDTLKRKIEELNILIELDMEKRRLDRMIMPR